MAVSSVPTSTGAIGQALQLPHKTPQQQGTGPTNSLAQTGGTQNTQQTAGTQTAQALKPVVNGQGQKTGQVLHTTA
ncbi:MAG: hypothetical protein JO002_10195 [Burkholderiaceae bacterium]|nr:hypothetical protein [Burkholderiaceae bacterium]